MRVGIDLTALTAEPTGVDTYLREFVLALGRVDRSTQYQVFVNWEDLSLFRGRLPENFRLRAWCLRNRGIRAAFQQGVLPAACEALGVDVLHSPSFLAPRLRWRTRHLVTVHDVTFFTMPHLHSIMRRSVLFRYAVERSARVAHMINVPSKATLRDLLELWPDVDERRVRVTAAGIGAEFSCGESADVIKHRHRLGLPAEYVLCVGTIEPRKNLELLVGAYGQLQTGTHLVLAGRLGWGYEGLLAEVRKQNLADRVHVTGYVSPEDLPWVYRGARIFVYPSLYEGFGFPPLEAMACGIPVIATRGSALEENLQGAATLVSAHCADELAGAMVRLLEDEQVRADHREAGLRRAAEFGWESVAKTIQECYRELAETD
ncbi:MAG: glycosyltransferase family 4 protein [Bryobacterales bacterium]|nr:glycosyltransferase family 4 protein [Bryobacterales bacterium]